jgi:hypothetical protein
MGNLRLCVLYSYMKGLFSHEVEMLHNVMVVYGARKSGVSGMCKLYFRSNVSECRSTFANVS